jgi:hypothetical protein
VCVCVCLVVDHVCAHMLLVYRFVGVGVGVSIREGDFSVSGVLVEFMRVMRVLESEVG